MIKDYLFLGIMMRNVFLSILVPIYNVEKYIERCMESVFNQITDDCEVILVDDGSSDSSGNICDDYQQKYPNICKVYHKENQGAYPTRNFALDKAQGEFIWLIDPDDYIEQDAITVIKSIVSENDNLDIITGAYRRFKDDWVGDIENSEKVPRIVSGEEYLVTGHFKNAYLWYHIYRRGFLLDSGIQFNDNLNTQGDWLFNAHAYVVAKRIYLSDKLIYNYFQGNPTSTLSRRDKQHLIKGVENSIKAELEMSLLCESYKETPMYLPLMNRLSFTSSGFFYSMFRFHLPVDIIRNVIDTYKEHDLYPISRTDNKKANLFITFANCKWLFMAVCSCRNLFKKV